MNSTAITTINLSALTYNLQLIRQLIPQKKILAMVKSNGYGHGLIPIAVALNTVDAFGVATISEAQQLREAGIKNDIVVMRGFVTAEEFPVFLKDPHLIACIHDSQQLLLLEKQKHPGNSLRIWLKIDTGMHRLGFDYRDFDVVYARINALNFIDKNFVVCSHLADADNPNTAFTQQQCQRFEKMTRAISNEKSLLNSAGIIAHSEFAFDWIRPGLMMFGVSPFQLNDTAKRSGSASDHVNDARHAVMKDFIPAMTLSSKLIAIKNVEKGEKIGYSCIFTAERDMKIGIIGMGYGDSYPRQAKNGTPVLIRGERCPIVGRVSMDMITVDVSHVKNVAVDDDVILWGKDLLVSEIAQYVDTVSHELLCHLTGRVQRIYK